MSRARFCVDVAISLPRRRNPLRSEWILAKMWNSRLIGNSRFRLPDVDRSSMTCVEPIALAARSRKMDEKKLVARKVCEEFHALECHSVLWPRTMKEDTVADTAGYDLTAFFRLFGDATVEEILSSGVSNGVLSQSR